MSQAFPSPSRRFAAPPSCPLAGFPGARRRLETEGVNVSDLSAGDADLPPPPQAVEALREALNDTAMSRYPFNLGLAAFRRGVAEWMARRYGAEVDPLRGVLPLSGSMEGIAHLPWGVLNPGDAALVPDPGYQLYVSGVWLAGGEPVPVPVRRENGFSIPFKDVPPA